MALGSDWARASWKWPLVHNVSDRRVGVRASGEQACSFKVTSMAPNPRDKPQNIGLVDSLLQGLPDG